MELRSKTATETPTKTLFRSPAQPLVSMEERTARKALLAHSAEREQYLEGLKQSIQSGAYCVNALEVAVAFVAERRRDDMPA